MSDPPALAVVVVTRDSAGDVPHSLTAVAAQLLSGDELVVVDNASSDATEAAARAAAPGATVLQTGANLGFAGGCHAGVRATTAPLLLFLNPDAIVAPGALDALRAAAARHPGWGAWQALVTLPDGVTVNTAGNVVHYLGFGWAGRLDRPVAEVAGDDQPAGFASGAVLVVRRDAWESTGGFDERYFMYVEDLDLSLRLRLAGHGVGLVPGARAAHGYDFVKGDYKWFYLERNRWWTILSDYPARLLLALAPGLLAFELALLLASARGGWLGPKLRSYAAVARELPAIARRRRAVQATRTVSAREFADGLAAHLDSPLLPSSRIIDALLRAYWAAVRATL